MVDLAKKNMEPCQNGESEMCYLHLFLAKVVKILCSILIYNLIVGCLLSHFVRVILSKRHFNKEVLFEEFMKLIRLDNLGEIW